MTEETKMERPLRAGPAPDGRTWDDGSPLEGFGPVTRALMSNEVAPPPESLPVPEFEHDGRMGQFFIRMDAFLFRPELVRAVFDIVWPIAIKPIAADDGTVLLHCQAYCSLFRKLSEGERVPPYDFQFEDGKDGDGQPMVGISVTEGKLPEQNRVWTPNRKERREMARHNQKAEKKPSLITTAS